MPAAGSFPAHSGRGSNVSDKSPKKDSAKKEGMSLKEKRSAKKIKQADKASKNA